MTSFREIGAALGISDESARKLYDSAMAKLRRVPGMLDLWLTMEDVHEARNGGAMARLEEMGDEAVRARPMRSMARLCPCGRPVAPGRAWCRQCLRVKAAEYYRERKAG